MKEFGGVSGIYSVELIIGDASISNPTLWHLTDLSLTFPEASNPTQPQDYTYKVSTVGKIPYLCAVYGCLIITLTSLSWYVCDGFPVQWQYCNQ